MANIVAIVARELLNYAESVSEEYHGGWPNNAEGNPVDRCTVHSTDISFSEECMPYNGRLYTGINAVEGLPWCSEWDDNGDVTKAEYDAFIQEAVGGDLSKLKAYFEDGTRAALKEIATLNKEVAKLVDRMVALAEPYGIDIHINLGERGSLDLNGPWDSSSAYC